ncbi:protein SHORT-ROOT-like [Curcuma longa]|uniref:protein SHORT-ROOT-like n=1 Tax=Curcuma longa TaxID=136217 RepID=UPI003D9E0C07
MQSPPPPITSARQFDLGPDPLSAEPTRPWAADLLRDCARAFADKDSANLHRLLWMLNELASPYGDCEQRLAYAFLQALFCRATASGDHCYSTSLAVAERTVSFASTRRLALKFQEAAPWSTFGHVAANGALLQALDGEPALHIVDVSNTFCTQWPTLLETLASRADADAPRVRLTVVSSTAAGVMSEIGARIEKFARLMGVPLEFRAVAAPALPRLADALRPEKLELRDGEVVAVNCVGALRRAGSGDSRDSFLRAAAALRPRVLTVVEDEADFAAAGEFMESFEECLRFYGAYFDMLEESFPATCNERLSLERECFRSLVGLLACEGGADAVVDGERRERGRQWCRRLERCGFETFGVSDDVIDDLKALLKRYRPGWSLLPAVGEASGMYLTWKENPVVWACAWKPK